MWGKMLELVLNYEQNGGRILHCSANMFGSGGFEVVSESLRQITNSVSVVNKMLLIFYHEK